MTDRQVRAIVREELAPIRGLLEQLVEQLRTGPTGSANRHLPLLAALRDHLPATFTATEALAAGSRAPALAEALAAARIQTAHQLGRRLGQVARTSVDGYRVVLALDLREGRLWQIVRSADDGDGEAAIGAIGADPIAAPRLDR